MSILKRIGSSFAAISALALATGLGSLIVRRFGLTEFWMVALSAAVGITILFTMFGAAMSLLRRGQLRGVEHMHEKLTTALNEIANGNFNVFVEVDPHAPHHEIGAAMNDMARKLGTLEEMRQDFISNASHEIQSPLTSIGGFAALLQKDGISSEERRHYADIIQSESKRLSSLSENLLKLSTLENNRAALNKNVFRLDKQLRQIILTLEPQWSGKHIILEADLPKCEIVADADLLSQVWMNLLVNAIKFTPGNGTISVCLEAGDSITVKIIDTGMGISPDDQIHIFERFYKVDKARDRSLGGNGLGLSIVKRIIELHDGRIAVQSAVSQGTVFEINLPK